MTWEELKEKAKEMFDCTVDKDNLLFIGNIFFSKDGGFYYGNIFSGDELIAENRTPEQMLMIMRGLE